MPRWRRRERGLHKSQGGGEEEGGPGEEEVRGGRRQGEVPAEETAYDR